MEEKRACGLSRPWIHALRAAVSGVLGLICLAGSRRREKRRGLSVLTGLLWLAGGAVSTLCLLREIQREESTKL